MKRSLSTFLAACLTLSLAAPAALAVPPEGFVPGRDGARGTPGGAYSDLDGHWAQEAVERWSGYGVVQGSDGAFRPNDSITRGELALILDRVMGYPQKAENTYDDLDETWYTDAVLRLSAAGVMEGAQGHVRPQDAVTRQETAVLLARAFQLEQVKGNGSFSDQDQIADWAKQAVETLSAGGYIQGYQGAFDPTGNITRASVVTILDNLFADYLSQEGEYAQDVEGNVLINADGVTLKNMTVHGDLIVAPGLGEGTLTLDNVTITGKAKVFGGGEHSVIFNNTNTNGGIVVNKVNGQVRVVVSGKSAVSVVVMESGGIVVTRDLDNSAAVAPVVIENVLEPGETVTLIGRFGTVTNNVENAAISADGSIASLVCNAQAEITGSAKVDKVTLAEGIDAITVDGKEVKDGQTGLTVGKPTATAQPASGGGSSGSHRRPSGGSSTPTAQPSAVPTATATPDPSTVPTDPSTAPTDPSTAPTEPSTVPTDPSASPSAAPTPTASPSLSDTAAQEAAKYETDVEIPLSVKAGDDVTGLVAALKQDMTADPSYTVTITETADVGNYLSVSGNKVTLDKLTQEGDEDGTAAFTLTIAKGEDTATVAVNVTIKAPGWHQASEPDGRFAEGYPQAEFVTGDPDSYQSTLALKVKLTAASETNPVEVFVVVNSSNSHYSSDVDAVLHGHVGSAEDIVWANTYPYLKITDTDEHIITTHLALDDDEDLQVHFVLKDAKAVSDNTTDLFFSRRMLAELDNMPPAIMSAFVNKAQNKVYLWFREGLDEASVPGPSAFALSSGTVTAVAVDNVTHAYTNGHVNTLGRAILSVAGYSEGTTVSYTAPEKNALQDRAATPNKTADFSNWTIRSAALGLEPENVFISEDGSYFYLRTTNCNNFLAHDGEDTLALTVKYGADEASAKAVECEKLSLSWSNSGDSADMYYKVKEDAPALTENGKFFLTVTPSENAIDYADDPVEAATCQQAPAAAPVTASSATYDGSTLELRLDGEINRFATPFACNFTLSVNGEEHLLRGTPTHRYADGQMDLSTVIFSADNLPVEIKAGDTLRLSYKLTHGDTHYILSEPSGKPMADFAIDVTNTMN